MKNALPLILILLVSCFAKGALPMAMRSWKSHAGTNLEARAMAVEDQVVTFEAAGGRVVKVPLDKLLEADRELIKLHFGVAETSAVKGTAVTLAHPLGKISGPVDAGGSGYFIYLPGSLQAGRTYPLLFYTSSGGGQAGCLDPMVEGAEICGWIVAHAVESKNGAEDNFTHTKRCVEHIKKSLPVTPGQIYFGGNSGGAREAFTNDSKLDGAGVLALIAGAQPGQMKKGNHYFFISGAYDFNRYGTASSYDEVNRSAAMRFHPEGHRDGPGWLMTEGMVWLEVQRQRKNSSDRSRPEFEARLLTWIESLKSANGHRAAWWTLFLTEGGVLPANQTGLARLHTELAANLENIAYIKGVADLELFAAKILSKITGYAPDCFNHTSPQIQKAAEKLLEEHAATPWVKEVLEGIKKNTDSG